MSSALVDKDVSPEKVSNEEPQKLEKASNENPQKNEEPQVFEEDPDFDDNYDYTDIYHKPVYLVFVRINLYII